MVNQLISNLKNNGPTWVYRHIARLQYYFYYRFSKSRTFKFNGNKYKYFNHYYNPTWHNERSVEIPIISKFLSENDDGNVLEIGNVLSHYFNINHDVVDKYEKAKGVINEDVVDFKSSKKYSLIISISTLEHVGWDEKPKDPKKILSALENLRNSLAPGGKLVVTMPIGHNSKLDNYLETGKLKFTENYYLKRISKNNCWKELNTGFYNAKLDFPFPFANLIFIGVYQNKVK